MYFLLIYCHHTYTRTSCSRQAHNTHVSSILFIMRTTVVSAVHTRSARHRLRSHLNETLQRQINTTIRFYTYIVILYYTVVSCRHDAYKFCEYKTSWTGQIRNRQKQDRHIRRRRSVFDRVRSYINILLLKFFKLQKTCTDPKYRKQFL